jgi:DNA-binding transcriptional regulator YiaG
MIGGMSELQTMTGEELRAIRQAIGDARGRAVYQAEMAAWMNVTLRGYQRWENGERRVTGPAVPLARTLLAAHT